MSTFVFKVLPLLAHDFMSQQTHISSLPKPGTENKRNVIKVYEKKKIFSLKWKREMKMRHKLKKLLGENAEEAKLCVWLLKVFVSITIFFI